MTEIFKRIVDEVVETSSRPCVNITAKRRGTALLQSKFGGTPYIPEGFTYPCDTITRKPLRLVSQINFAEIPEIEGFPRKGILQFFICDSNDDSDVSLGIGEDQTVQDGWRVIYHKDITKPARKDIPTFTYEHPNSYFPIYSEFSLTFEKKVCKMSMHDFEFNDMFLDIYKKYVKTDANRVNSYGADGDIALNLSDEEREYLFEVFSGWEHRIGGHPDFTQWDQRNKYHIGHDRYTDYDILLFQIVSQCEVDKWYDICWCDGGIANLFIKSDDLKKLDFSNVLYTWDCG